MADNYDPMEELEELEARLIDLRDVMDGQLDQLCLVTTRLHRTRRKMEKLECRLEQLAEKIAMDSEAQQTDPRGGSMEFPTPPSEN